jgi:hypothetical protein
MKLTLALAGAALLTIACASAPPPTAEMAMSTAAVERAAGAGGGELASPEMARARDKLARANMALAANDNDGARRLAHEAQSDAALAQSKAESARARKAADELQESTRVLRLELDRKAP